MPSSLASGKLRSSVLLVTRNLPPLRGGMENLNRRLVASFIGHADIYVIGPEGCGRCLDDGVRCAEVPVRPLWRFLLQASVRALVRARCDRPDKIIAGSGLLAPTALLAARLSGASAVAYIHGLDVVVRSRSYRLLWLPCLRRCDIVLANSHNTARLAAESGIPSEALRVLNPGVAMSSEPPAADDDFRRRHGLCDRTILLSVGRLTPRKGLADFVARALPAIARRDPAVCLVIVGGEPVDALLRTRGSEATILRAAAEHGMEEHVRLLGSLPDEDLESAYAAASVTVFPVLDLPGDVEGFGMVALESASHGVPTIAFAAGGVPDAIADGVSGRLLPPGGYSAFAEAVCQVLREDRARWAESCRGFAARHSWEAFSQELRAHTLEVAG